MTQDATRVTQADHRPQSHWTVVGAIKAARALIKAADDLSFAAQITVGTAGRDAALCAAIAHWTAERDKQKRVLRIIELEGDDPEVGVGFGLLPSRIAVALAGLNPSGVAALIEAAEKVSAGFRVQAGIYGDQIQVLNTEYPPISAFLELATALANIRGDGQ